MAEQRGCKVNGNKQEDGENGDIVEKIDDGGEENDSVIESTIDKHDKNKVTKLVNIILLGTVFMLLAGRVTIMVLKTVMNSAKDPTCDGFVDPTCDGYVEGFEGDGYTANAILYGIFAVSNFLAPSVIAVIGPKFTMFIGGLGYLAYAAQMFYPNDGLMYTAAGLNGLGAALLWTGQGNFLTINSDSHTIARNSGIFWALYQLSGVIGNTFVFFQFRGVPRIDSSSRTKVTIAMSGMCAGGLLVALVLRPTPWAKQSNKQGPGPITAFRNCISLLKTKTMARLCFSFFYSGLETTFWVGVFTSSIGFFQNLGSSRKEIMGITGIFISIASTFIGLVFGVFGKVTTKFGRDPIVLLGFVIHSTAFFLTFLQLPHLSPLGETDSSSYLLPRPAFLVMTGCLLGIGDACLMTQIMSILSGVYSHNSSGAFALMKFIQSIGVAAGFTLSTQLGLYWQLLILETFSVISTIAFCSVEWEEKRKLLDLKLQKDNELEANLLKQDNQDHKTAQ